MLKRKVAVIGLDSITPVMIERFVAEGRMPNLKRLRERGWSSELTSTMPATTPAAWTTVATGAWPSTHGVEGFAVHLPGRLTRSIIAVARTGSAASSSGRPPSRPASARSC
jgi:predicted AlkP superfamily phosphohydrolase/phosphomutase